MYGVPESIEMDEAIDKNDSSLSINFNSSIAPSKKLINRYKNLYVRTLLKVVWHHTYLSAAKFRQTARRRARRVDRLTQLPVGFIC